MHRIARQKYSTQPGPGVREIEDKLTLMMMKMMIELMCGARDNDEGNLVGVTDTVRYNETGYGFQTFRQYVARRLRYVCGFSRYDITRDCE